MVTDGCRGIEVRRSPSLSDRRLEVSAAAGKLGIRGVCLLCLLALCGCYSPDWTGSVPAALVAPQSGLHISIAVSETFAMQYLLPGEGAARPHQKGMLPEIPYFNKGSAFHVVLMNVSSRPLLLPSEDCREGYFSLRVFAVDEAGRVYCLRKKPRDRRLWHLRSLNFTGLMPGQTVVWTVRFALSDDEYPDIWDDVGKPYTGYIDTYRMYPWVGFPLPPIPDPSNKVEGSGEQPTRLRVSAVYETFPRNFGLREHLLDNVERALHEHIWLGTVQTPWMEVEVHDYAKTGGE